MPETKILPLAAMEKLMKKVGLMNHIEDVRVSDGAKEALRESLEARSKIIALQAVKLATHAKRDTVKRRDILLAAKMTLKRNI